VTVGRTDGGSRYLTLDAMRGLAALAVVSFHAPEYFGMLTMHSAYLSVDLFFILSGFVLSHAYGAKLAEGMSFRAFMSARIARLYPLYLLSILVSIPAFLIWLRTGQVMPLAGAAILISALAFLPSPIDRAGFGILYPLNGPAWSLGFELAANALFALTTRYLTTRRLAVLVAVFAGLLIAASLSHGSLDGGVTWASAYVAGARVLFGFFAGVLLYRLRLPAPQLSPLFLLLALLAVLAIVPPAPVRWLYDSIAALLAFPVLIACGARSEPGGTRTTWLFETGGAISYAVYVLHIPALRWLRFARELPLIRDIALPLLALLFVVGLLFVAHTATRLDILVRKRLQLRRVAS
jgi:peptidoglycan/LPS O-acetylase OafA/YrhL